MAIGKTGQKFSGKTYYAEVRLKEDGKFLDIPHYEIQHKIGNDYPAISTEELAELTGTDGPARDIAGDLVAVGTYRGEFQGAPIYNVSVTLRDDKKDENYVVKYISGNNFGRGLSNSLLNLTGADNVQIGFYGQKSKTDKTKTFPAVAIRQGNSETTVKWKYDPKIVTEMVPREFEGKGGKMEKDWTKVDEFIFFKLMEFGEKVKGGGLNTKTPEKQPVYAESTAATSSESDEEAVPF